MPDSLKPQLATLVADAPSGDDWLHEIKHDGYRLLAYKSGPSARLQTRQGNDWTARFPEVAKAVAALPVQDAILDGEVVAMQRDGTSSFQKLQNQLRAASTGGVRYFVFDLPYCGGSDLRTAPLVERKQLLRRLLESADEPGPLRYSDHVEGAGPQMLEQARKMGLEGIVSKRADAPYVSARTHTWVKSKCIQRQELVIGGYTDPEGARIGFGALLLGHYRDGKLIYCGRTGTGFDAQTLRSLWARLRKLEQPRPAFAEPPTGAMARGVHWVQPLLVAEVEFREWTDDGILRQPSFQGLREDRDPKEITREQPAAPPAASPPAPRTRKAKAGPRANSEVQVAGVKITNPNRVVFPGVNLTKADVARYYESIADWILPHIVQRPLSLIRCPEGQSGDCFFQRHRMVSMPSAIEQAELREDGKKAAYLFIKDLRGLISLVQFGVLELHPWGSRVDDADKPDRITFDLDPHESVAWPDVRRAAVRLRELLAGMDLQCFVKTSGGKGLHVVVPIQRRGGWSEVKAFALGVAERMTRDESDRYLATASKAKRAGRIFIDYLRNNRGATSVAAYSTRARPGAPVSTPISWDELGKLASGGAFDIPAVLARVRTRPDPWSGLEAARQRLTANMLP